MTLLVGARTPGDLLWHTELSALARRDPRFSYVPVVSQPDVDWSGRTGYVQAHLAELVARLPPGFQVRVCGAKPMVFACLEGLRALGVADEQLEAESY